MQTILKEDDDRIEQICKETCYEEWQEHAAEIVDGIKDGKDEQSHE